jgi:hypothetical protein
LLLAVGLDLDLVVTLAVVVVSSLLADILAALNLVLGRGPRSVSDAKAGEGSSSIRGLDASDQDRFLTTGDESQSKDPRLATGENNSLS